MITFRGIYLKIFMSHSLLWRRIVLLMGGVYSSNHRALHSIEISMTRRLQKSVGLSVCLCLYVCPFATLTKESLLLHYWQLKINSHIRWKGLTFSTRKWSDIFKELCFKNFRSNFRKMRYLHKNSCSSLLTVE